MSCIYTGLPTKDEAVKTNKTLKNKDSKVKLNLFPYKQFGKAFSNDWAKILVAENNKYKKSGGINSVQSSLKSHPFWATLK